MNRSDLADSLHSQTASLTRAQAHAAVNTLFEIIANQLRLNTTVTISGFGKFEPKQRPERTIHGGIAKGTTVPAHTAPVFRPSKTLKDALKSQ